MTNEFLTTAIAAVTECALLKRDGFTITKDGDSPKSGFAVGGAGLSEVKFPASLCRFKANLIWAEVEPKIQQHLNLVSAEDNIHTCLGGWVEDNQLVIDVSDVFRFRGDAISVAKERGERAIFDLSTGETINVG